MTYTEQARLWELAIRLGWVEPMAPYPKALRALEPFLPSKPAGFLMLVPNGYRPIR